MSESMTLAEAKAWMLEHVEEGADCLLCAQFAKVYKRKIHRTMARDLIRMWRHAGRQWFRLPDVAPNGDNAKFQYWGLIEPGGGVREDGSDRTGWWRFTEAGQDWVLGWTTVPKYARIYNGNCLGLVGDQVGIREALGNRFNYDELMSQ